MQADRPEIQLPKEGQQRGQGPVHNIALSSVTQRGHPPPSARRHALPRRILTTAPEQQRRRQPQLAVKGAAGRGIRHPCAKSFRHPNWNSQHATIPYKNSVIGQAIKRLTNGQLRSLPPNGVQWLPADEVWTGGEALRSWKASILGHSNQTQAAATDRRPDQNRGKAIHLGVARGGSDVYPSLQGSLTSTSTDASTDCIFDECLLDTGCLFANFGSKPILRALMQSDSLPWQMDP